MRLLTVERDAFLEAVTGEAGVNFEYRDLLDMPLTDVLRELPTFDRVDAQGLKRLVRASRREEISEGTVVCEVGDVMEAAYVILKGRVELQRDGQVRSVLMPGDIFGELSVTHETPSADRAVVATVLVAAVLPADAMLAETTARAQTIPSQPARS